MNYMAEVAKMLGVELGEYFEIYRCDGTYFLTHSGLYHNESGFESEKMLINLLSGEYHIKRKPWRPKREEVFWHINPIGDPILDKYDGTTSYLLNFYKIGNCYRTCEQAEANRDKWISFYASDESVEV